jgi:hypothetical protein
VNLTLASVTRSDADAGAPLYLSSFKIGLENVGILREIRFGHLHKKRNEQSNTLQMLVQRSTSGSMIHLDCFWLIYVTRGLFSKIGSSCFIENVFLILK